MMLHLRHSFCKRIAQAINFFWKAGGGVVKKVYLLKAPVLLIQRPGTVRDRTAVPSRPDFLNHFNLIF